MRKKFNIIDASTGKKFKPAANQSVIMTDGGVFLLLTRVDWEGSYTRKLSEVLPRYDVVWRGE